MSKWVVTSSLVMRQFLLTVELKNQFQELLEEEVIWYKTKYILDIRYKMSKDFLAFPLLEPLYDSFNEFIFSALAENDYLEKDYNHILNELSLNPSNVLFHANKFKYQTVVAAAKFLSICSGNETLKNEIIVKPHSIFKNSYFNSVDYENQYAKSKNNFLTQINGYLSLKKRIEETIQPIEILINSSALLYTTMVKNAAPKYNALFNEMVKQKVIQIGDVVCYENPNVNLLEYYICLPNKNFYEKAKILIMNFVEDINLKEFIEYFNSHPKKIININGFEEEKENYMNIMNYVKKRLLYESLNKGLSQNSKKDNIKKI